MTLLYIVGDIMFTANVGDSRSLLRSGQSTVALTMDHKPTVAEEERRIRDAGGFVVMGRVMGKLAVARALGDPDFKLASSALLSEFGVKDPVVTAMPDTTSRKILEEDKFLVLACDGLFDVMRNEEVTAFISMRLELGETLDEIARALVTEAIRNRGSTDNVTAMIVHFLDL